MERPDLVEEADDVDNVLRALERRRGWVVDVDERKSMLTGLVCCVVLGWWEWIVGWWYLARKSGGVVY
jgi:hypothetical protein